MPRGADLEDQPRRPFDNWSTGSGFEYFYGFIGGETHQFYATLHEGATPAVQQKTPQEGYHLTEDMADKAISYIRTQTSLMPDKPFFIYFAPSTRTSRAGIRGRTT